MNDRKFYYLHHHRCSECGQEFEAEWILSKIPHAWGGQLIECDCEGICEPCTRKLEQDQHDQELMWQTGWSDEL